MFNALTVSGLRAPQTSAVTTTALFTPLDPSRQPNRKDILQLRRSAIALAKELSTDGTAEGYIGLVVHGPTYDRITGNAQPYQLPVHPGPTVPAGANQLSAYHNEENHKRQLKRFEDYKTASKTIKDAVLSTVPEAFIATLSDPDVGFGNVTILQIFDHLMATYGTVTREDLDQNEEELKAPWTPATPIEDLWLQAAKAQLFPPASDALSDNYILRALVQNVRNTKSFDSTLKRFDELPTVDQTLARFKLEMNKTYRTWVRANQNSTAAEAGYSSVNLAQTPATPTPASKYSCKWGTKTYTYCWSHGLSEVKDNIPEHNSSTCNNRHEGHQEAATFDNRMTGCNPMLATRRIRRDNNRS